MYHHVCERRIKHKGRLFWLVWQQNSQHNSHSHFSCLSIYFWSLFYWVLVSSTSCASISHLHYLLFLSAGQEVFKNKSYIKQILNWYRFRTFLALQAFKNLTSNNLIPPFKRNIFCEIKILWFEAPLILIDHSMLVWLSVDKCHSFVCSLFSWTVTFVLGRPYIPFHYPLFKQCDPRWGNDLMGGSMSNLAHSQ
jgi:hypothetical protein